MFCVNRHKKSMQQLIEHISCIVQCIKSTMCPSKPKSSVCTYDAVLRTTPQCFTNLSILCLLHQQSSLLTRETNPVLLPVILTFISELLSEEQTLSLGSYMYLLI